MRLYALKLSQPTVFALTFLLLIVMNLEQVWCNEEIKILYHSFSQKYLTMHENGSVRTLSHSDGPISHQCLKLNTVKMQDEKPILSIYNPAAKMFLCFNKNGKLVGRRICTEDCHFFEKPDEAGYIEFRQAHRPQRTVAFSMNGRPQKRRNKKKNNAQFMKTADKNGLCPGPSTPNPLDPSLNETHVRVRHKHGIRHRKKHKPMV